jgi:predicted RNase H-like HicB family nuclease
VPVLVFSRPVTRPTLYWFVSPPFEAWTNMSYNRAVMEFRIETEQEVDGRWIAQIEDLPGVLAYGETKGRAVSRATALALQVVADRIEHGEIDVAPDRVIFLAA